jgi:hypothetical protein
MMETWRLSVSQVLGRLPDLESTLIIGAVISIGAEKFMRSELEPELSTLENPVPAELLTRCNVSSVAAAAHLNRETARRKINELLEEGILARDEHGLRVADGLLQLPLVRETTMSQLKALRRVIEELRRIGVVNAR